MPDTPKSSSSEFVVETQDLKGRIAIVTGGTTGIGRATAILLAKSGAKVVINGRHDAELQDALHDIKAIGGECHGLIADNAYEEEILRVFDETRRTYGDADILINNAALPAQSIIDGESYEDALYKMRVNILGYLTCIREAVKMMRRKGGGHIVNVGSMSAEVREVGSDVYVATKGAIEAMSESLRKALSSDNIKLSLIEPGMAGTNLHGEPPDVSEQMDAEAAGRMLLAEDVAVVIYHTLILPPRSNVLLTRIAPLKQSM